MAMIYSQLADGQWQDRRGANALDGGAHFYDAYETADGKFISIGPVEPQFYRLLLDRIGLGDDPDLQEQNDRAAWPAQKARVATAIKSRTRDEWCDILEGTDACFAPVLSMSEAPHHKHNVARQAFVEVAGEIQPAPTPRYSRTVTDTPRPMTGDRAASAARLAHIGIDGSAADDLRRDGVMA